MFCCERHCPAGRDMAGTTSGPGSMPSGCIGYRLPRYGSTRSAVGTNGAFSRHMRSLPAALWTGPVCCWQRWALVYRGISATEDVDTGRCRRSPVVLTVHVVLPATARIGPICCGQRRCVPVHGVLSRFCNVRWRALRAATRKKAEPQMHADTRGWDTGRRTSVAHQACRGGTPARHVAAHPPGPEGTDGLCMRRHLHACPAHLLDTGGARNRQSVARSNLLDGSPGSRCSANPDICCLSP